MENFESGISEEKRQSIELGINDIYNKFDILYDQKLTNDEKKKEIDNLINKDEASKAYFSDLKDLKNDYLNGNMTEEEFKKNLEEHKQKTFEKIAQLREDAYATVAQKEERENCKDALRLIGVNEEIVENLSSFQIDEVVKNFSSPTINEDFLETLDDLNLPRKDADNIKKQYQYKVEGKITSGLSELDTFLGMIQPGLDLILKTGAKLFYEGIVDNVEKKFLGNEEQGVKSDFAIWAENKDGLKKSYDFLHKYGNLPETDTFKYRTNTIKDENHVATYFSQMIIEKINENRKNEMNEYSSKIEEYNKLSDEEKAKTLKPTMPPHKGEEFKGNAFDETKDMTETKRAIQNIIKDVISKTRQKDENGNSIAKPTDEGKAALNSIMYLTDLFNKKNSPEFKNEFAGLIDFYKNGYEEKFTGNFIEDDDYFKKEAEDKEKADMIKNFFAASGGPDAFADKIKGNDK